jgi:hypothetical protein
MLTLEEITQQTVDQVAKAILAGSKDGTLRKALAVSDNLIGYNLQAPAKQFVPLMSDFARSIPRKVLPGSDSVNWKVISSLSSPKLSTTEQAAGALFTTTVVPKVASYKHIALRGKVTRAAVAASQGFDPALAKETANTLLLAMKLEEQAILGGNVTALATPGAPTVTEIEAIAGATIGAASYFVRIAALTLPAANRLSLSRPLAFDGTNAVLDGVAIAAVDPASDGVTVVGAEGTVTTTGANNSLKITWTPVNGAAAYAVFIGTTTGAANLKCEGIVTQCNVTFRTLATTGQAGSALAGTSADANIYDGIIAQLFAAGSGAYLKNVAGKLSGDAATGEVPELQDAFAYIWDNAKIGKHRVLMAGQEARSLSARAAVANAMNITVSPESAGRIALTQGGRIGSIINSQTGDICPVETLPWMPGGMILILPTEIPYNDANQETPFDIACGFDWERWDYASTSSTGPIYEFDTRYWGVLRAVFTGGCGVLHNILKG